MKILYYRVLPILLIFTFLLPLSSCKNNQNDVSNAVSSEEKSLESLTIASNGQSEYTIVWRSKAKSEEQKAATDLRKFLQDTTGTTLDITTDLVVNTSNDILNKAIFVGRVELVDVQSMWDGLGKNDYNVTEKDGNVYILGGSETAVYYAVRHFMNNFVDAEKRSASIPTEYTYSFQGASSREDYISDPTKLLHSWISEYETPAALLDIKEKQQALEDTDGRFMTIAHRGDAARYPENSIEGIISSCMMGVDVCEIDVRVTKDGIPILMHDEKLTRTTNVLTVKGTTVNGIALPTSEYVKDWTFEQIRCLKLKTGNGLDGSTVTEYVIPTLDEAVKVAKGRMFLLCDKLDSASDIKNMAWPIFKANEAYNTMMYCGTVDFAGAISIRKSLAASNAEGLAPYYMARVSYTNISSWTSAVDNLEAGNIPAMARIAGWDQHADLDKYLNSNGESIKKISGRIRLQADCYQYENDESFEKLLAVGINMSLVNDPLTSCKFIAQKYFNN